MQDLPSNPPPPFPQSSEYNEQRSPLMFLLRSNKILICSLGFLILLILMGGMFLFMNVSSRNNRVVNTIAAIPSITPTPVIYPTSYPSNEDIKAKEWKDYRLATLGLSFKLPAKVSALGDLVEEKVAGETGTQLCGIFEKKTGFLPIAYAGGGCSTNTNPYLILGTTSVDYSAGREGMFTDYQGFLYKNEQYYIKFVANAQLSDAFPQERISSVSNTNGVEIIKIQGTMKRDEGPTPSNALGNNTGAIINTKNKTYPGLALIFKEGLSAAEIDQILLSFAFTQ